MRRFDRPFQQYVAIRYDAIRYDGCGRAGSGLGDTTRATRLGGVPG